MIWVKIHNLTKWKLGPLTYEIFFSLTLVSMDVVAKETSIVPWQFEQIN